MHVAFHGDRIISAGSFITRPRQMVQLLRSSVRQSINSSTINPFHGWRARPFDFLSQSARASVLVMIRYCRGQALRRVIVCSFRDRWKSLWQIIAAMHHFYYRRSEINCPRKDTESGYTHCARLASAARLQPSGSSCKGGGTRRRESREKWLRVAT